MLTPSVFRLSRAALVLCGAAFSPLVSASKATTPAVAVRPTSASASAAELGALPDAESAETWLEHNIPVGTVLAEFPGFFAAASEVFLDSEENLLVFVYPAAEEGRWLAWVSFDAEGYGVVHTAAIDL